MITYEQYLEAKYTIDEWNKQINDAIRNSKKKEKEDYIYDISIDYDFYPTLELAHCNKMISDNLIEKLRLYFRGKKITPPDSNQYYRGLTWYDCDIMNLPIIVLSEFIQKSSATKKDVNELLEFIKEYPITLTFEDEEG